jgi:hypothetical protein
MILRMLDEPRTFILAALVFISFGAIMRDTGHMTAHRFFIVVGFATAATGIVVLFRQVRERDL